MKKKILISSIAIIVIIIALFFGTKIYRYVQSVAFQNLVGHFISLGVIPSQNVAAAYAALGDVPSSFEAATARTLVLSTDVTTPATTTIIALSGPNSDEVFGLPLLVFDITNNGVSDVKITNVNVYFGSAASPAVIVAYLFDGSTQISSAPVIDNNATFQNINYTILGTEKKVFTVKIDAKGVVMPVIIIPSVAAVTALDSESHLVKVYGSAVGNLLTLGEIPPVTTTINQSSSLLIGVNQNPNANVPAINTPPEIISYIQGSDQTQNTIHPGEQTTIYGSNLPTNPTVHIGSQYVLGQTNTGGTQIIFTVPAELADGTYGIYVTSANEEQSNVVTVTSSPVLSIVLLSPNGGENFEDKDTITYSWTQNIASSSIEVSLINYTTHVLYYTSSLIGALGQNTETFSIGGLNVPDGQYIIKICDSNSVSCSSSAAPFNIIPETGGGGFSSGGGSSSLSPSSPTTVTLDSNQDYYFHILSGSLTLGDFTSSGFVPTTGPFPQVQPPDELLFYSQTPPTSADSFQGAFYLSSNGNWGEVGSDPSSSYSTDLIYTYFMITTYSTLTESGYTLTLPPNIVYDGSTSAGATNGYTLYSSAM